MFHDLIWTVKTA